jgi:hypothetical protein
LTVASDAAAPGSILPKETWAGDRDRCRRAGIPDELVFRTKIQIAAEQIERATANGLRFGWLTFDEFYSRSGPFLRTLDQRGQNYVAEVPVDTTLWTKRPDILYKAHCRNHGSGRQKHYPRLKVKNNPPVEVRNILTFSALPSPPNDLEITCCRYFPQRHNSLLWESVIAL